MLVPLRWKAKMACCIHFVFHIASYCIFFDILCCIHAHLRTSAHFIFHISYIHFTFHIASFHDSYCFVFFDIAHVAYIHFWEPLSVSYTHIPLLHIFTFENVAYFRFWESLYIFTCENLFIYSLLRTCTCCIYSRFENLFQSDCGEYRSLFRRAY